MSRRTGSRRPLRRLGTLGGAVAALTAVRTAVLRRHEALRPELTTPPPPLGGPPAAVTPAGGPPTT